MVKNLTANEETRVPCLGREDLLEEEMPNCSPIFVFGFLFTIYTDSLSGFKSHPLPQIILLSSRWYLTANYSSVFRDLANTSKPMMKAKCWSHSYSLYLPNLLLALNSLFSWIHHPLGSPGLHPR